jgi:hypothetical protein
MGVLSAISGKEAGRPQLLSRKLRVSLLVQHDAPSLEAVPPVREAGLEVHERILGAADSAAQVQNSSASSRRPTSRAVDQDLELTELERPPLGARQVVLDDAAGFAAQACADDRLVNFDDAEMDVSSKFLPETRQVVVRKELLMERRSGAAWSRGRE